MRHGFWGGCAGQPADSAAWGLRTPKGMKLLVEMNFMNQFMRRGPEPL